MSKFFCDTNCELPLDKFDGLNIELIKMPYTLDGVETEYDLGRKVDGREFFKKMRDGASAKTQALNEMNYIDYFEPVLKAGEDIIYVSFSHKMSGTFDQMNAAIKTLSGTYPDRKITVADTRGISMAAGIVVYYAALKHNEGASDDEVKAFVESFREKVGCYFTVDDLVYLKRGGRLSAFKAMVGSIFNMKPIITINKEGSLVSLENAKGRKKALHQLVNFMETDGADITYPVTLMNGDSDDDANLVKEMIKEKYPDVEIWDQLVGPVVGSHCGPGTIGLIFIKK